MGLSELKKFFTGHILIETNCATIGRELQSEGVCRSLWFAVMTDIKEQIKIFASVQINIVKQDQNKLAHEIAVTAIRLGDHLRLTDVHDNIQEED